jgi:hypothetical protein
MKIVRWAWCRLLRRPVLDLPPVRRGTSQAIQDREAAAARERMLAQARRRGAGHLYDGPHWW